MTAEKWVPSTEDLRGILREYYLGHDHFDAWLAARDRAVKAEAQSILDCAPRFWPRVEVGSANECWLWTGPTVGIGHGRYDSPAGSTAHRYAWASGHGLLPSQDQVVRHQCDNPPCCNPAHLLIGTQEDNVADMIDRGRARFTRTSCRNGHDRTPENTLVKPNGERRCKVCDRDTQRNRWNAAERVSCPHCGAVTGLYNMRRHLINKHEEVWSIGKVRELCDRADLIEKGADA